MRPLFFILILVLGSGCGLVGEDGADGPKTLMPLEVGNTWTFEQRGDGETRRYDVVLADTRTFDGAGAEQVDGEIFYEMQLRFEEWTEEGNFVREADEGIMFLYYTAESGYMESNLFRYPLDDTEYQYTDVRGLSLTYEVEGEIVETPAGTFPAYTYSGYDEDPDVSISFAPGVGPVRLTESGSETLLVDYEVSD